PAHSWQLQITDCGLRVVDCRLETRRLMHFALLKRADRCAPPHGRTVDGGKVGLSGPAITHDTRSVAQQRPNASLETIAQAAADIALLRLAAKGGFVAHGESEVRIGA
ncbi:MAG: hypothetical protein ACP5MD_16635, partial [Verrucomicrobiia bacterium]